MISHIFLLLYSHENGADRIEIRDMLNDQNEVWLIDEEPRTWAAGIFAEMGYHVKEVSDIGFNPTTHFYVITDQPELSLQEATKRLEP
jgi:hypothetical protein